MTKVLLNIRLDPTLVDRLKEGAAQSNRSLSNYIETLLWDCMATHELPSRLHMSQVSNG
jgi:hypothetical protein